jgi:hypothetical protein
MKTKSFQERSSFKTISTLEYLSPERDLEELIDKPMSGYHGAARAHFNTVCAPLAARYPSVIL